jgi:anti-anti-sigma factor
MQITTRADGHYLELHVSGRLDNESSSQLMNAIDDAVRQGSHAVMLDLSEVNYLSSAGIGTLVKAHKQFQALRGFFGVVAVSPEGAEVIRLTGLTKTLLADCARMRGSTIAGTDSVQPEFRIAAAAEMNYEIYDVASGTTMSCEVIGDPALLASDNYTDRHCQSIDCPTSTIGIGLGAFGRDFSDCTNRFGEFLAVGGATAQQPTNVTCKPDFQRMLGDYVPRVQMLYGIKCTGDFANLIRFERHTDENQLTLSALADQMLTLSNTDLAAMVFLAESTGLIGAALHRSPADCSPASNSHPESSRLSHPEIRRWLSFTPDHTYVHSLVLAVGVVSRGEPTGDGSSLAPLLRPLSKSLDVRGHFHAAVFSYRPFKKRRLDLTETVNALFETEDVQAVLHLLHDDRQLDASGESEFANGACWVGPIRQVTKAHSNIERKGRE